MQTAVLHGNILRLFDVFRSPNAKNTADLPRSYFLFDIFIDGRTGNTLSTGNQIKLSDLFIKCHFTQ